MELNVLAQEFSICKLDRIPPLDFRGKFFFLSQTDEEISLVCETEDVSFPVVRKDDGWKAFRVQGVLDFSLVGVLSRISTVLANHQISMFAVSTYNTDYILTKTESFAKALQVLAAAGYPISEEKRYRQN